MWMVPGGTMDTSASMVYGAWSTILWMVVGSTPTEQTSQPLHKVAYRASQAYPQQALLPCTVGPMYPLIVKLVTYCVITSATLTATKTHTLFMVGWLWWLQHVLILCC